MNNLGKKIISVITNFDLSFVAEILLLYSIVSQFSEGDFPDVEEYLTLIKKSDDAFRTLIDYFDLVPAPTVILMFGDHQPNVDEIFYETMMKKPLEEWSLKEAQVRFEVPFFIWTNYEIVKN